MVISSIEREPFAKLSRLRKIEIAKIVRKGAFAKYTSRENLYVYGMQSVVSVQICYACVHSATVDVFVPSFLLVLHSCYSKGQR